MIYGQNNHFTKHDLVILKIDIQIELYGLTEEILENTSASHQRSYWGREQYSEIL